MANYNLGADWNGQNGNVTTVGAAGLLSASFFGTFDQGGNVWEWTEDDFGPFFRIIRQASWGHEATYMAASYREYADSGFHDGAAVGFRVATIPEPEAITARTGWGYRHLHFRSAPQAEAAQGVRLRGGVNWPKVINDLGTRPVLDRVLYWRVAALAM